MSKDRNIDEIFNKCFYTELSITENQLVANRMIEVLNSRPELEINELYKSVKSDIIKNIKKDQSKKYLDDIYIWREDTDRPKFPVSKLQNPSRFMPYWKKHREELLDVINLYRWQWSKYMEFDIRKSLEKNNESITFVRYWVAEAYDLVVNELNLLYLDGYDWDDMDEYR